MAALTFSIMANQYISIRNLRFLLFEVLEAQKLTRFPYYADYDTSAINMTLDAAKQLADKYLFPSYREMDKQKARYEDGTVYVHPAIGEGMRALGEAGWISAHDKYEYGGQQMPLTVRNAGLGIFYAANANLASHAALTEGAANLIGTFGAEELRTTYMDQLYAGQWQGTMALTEPQAGSSLSDLSTTATPTDKGYYLIKGQKIYISGGDHNAVDNIVHLLLARIDGAPAGTKGISLFVVPKFRMEDGQPVDNHVTTAGLYGTRGQKGYVAAHLMLGEQGETRGYLVGEVHRGLSYMFKMMNEARIGTGLMATGCASAAYYASLQYARERPQGRHPDNKDLNAPPVIIIEHADVRRMLLQQKAIVEGSLALLMQCSYYADLSQRATGQEQEEAHLLLELLTPIAKSYPAEMGIVSVSAGMQVLGGAGYTDDFPLEQYYRDIRINAIYEGTTTIHGMDLLGRKIPLQQGKAARLYATEMQKTIKAALPHPDLSRHVQDLIRTAEELQQTTAHLLALAQQENARVFLADATLYLEFFSLVTVAWMWLKQGVSAQEGLQKEDLSSIDENFYRSKLHALDYYFAYELPKIQALKTRLLDDRRITLSITADEIV